MEHLVYRTTFVSILLVFFATMNVLFYFFCYDLAFIFIFVIQWYKSETSAGTFNSVVSLLFLVGFIGACSPSSSKPPGVPTACLL